MSGFPPRVLVVQLHVYMCTHNTHAERQAKYAEAGHSAGHFTRIPQAILPNSSGLTRGQSARRVH